MNPSSHTNCAYKDHCSVVLLPGWISDPNPTDPQGMSRLSSLLFIRSFSTESPSNTFSDPCDKGAELKEGAAQSPLGRPPPKPPNPATTYGQENNETDHRQEQLLPGCTIPHPEESPIRSLQPPLRSLSLNLPRENIHQLPIVSKENHVKFHRTQNDSKQPPLRLDSRLPCKSEGRISPSTLSTSVPPIPTQVSEETEAHAKSECRKELVLPNNALPISLSTPVFKVSGAHKDEMVVGGKSCTRYEYQQCTSMRQPIVDNTLYCQQCIIWEGSWKIDENAKAPITIQMECQPNEDGNAHPIRYENVTDGHPIARCVLDKFKSNGRFYRGDTRRHRKKTNMLVTAGQCTTQTKRLFPYWMDSSTERLEKSFAEQFQTRNFIMEPGGCDVTLPILAVMMYRSAFGVSISLKHFVTSGCLHCYPYSLRVQWTLIELKKTHDIIVLRLKSRNRKCLMEEIIAKCINLNIIYEVRDATEVENWLIEYPHFVEILFRPTLGKMVCLYMQIPPFCFAMPLFESDGSQNDKAHRLLESHFTQIVCEINRKLLDEREKFFEHKPEVRKEENLGMIYPYRFDSEADCRHLHITIDTCTSVE